MACVCCPYPFVAVPAVLAYIALIFTWLAAIICKFFIITVGGEQGNLLVGLWSVESPEPWTIQASDTYCRPWNDGILLNDDDLDGALNAARAFGIISGVLGTIAFIMILVPSCVMFDDNAGNCYLRTLCCLCLFTGIATLLDLIALASSVCTDASECKLQSAGILSIVGGTMWILIAGLIMHALKHPRSIRRQDDLGVGAATTPLPEQAPTEEKVVQSSQNADGTTITKTTTTIINPDGSKTVTETTETIPVLDA